ncbi:MAG: relaxase/mobilization nuclease domain-containing protein [Bdellovibrionales bacterium]
MAVVKILWNRNVVGLEQYLFEGRDVDDPLEMNGCVEGFISEQFIGTQVHFGERTGVNVIHIIQSWHEADSQKLAPEEFTMIGRKLVEEKFPGHQFCVVTHTETGRVHNHIMVNPVSEENGSRIHNKTRLLYDLREQSDHLCAEQGLSLVEAHSQETWKRTPEKVREMRRRGGFQWVLDLKEKCDFAQSVATSFDEYAGVLNHFGIQVRVENKNISYHYPGKKPKRGDTRGLGEKYSNEGLKDQFRANYEKFFEAGLKVKPISEVDFNDHWRFHRSGNSEYFVPLYRYKDLVIPPSLLKSVQGIDLEAHAASIGLELVELNGEKKVLKNREHISINGSSWKNERTGIEGHSIEFLTYLHDESWLRMLRRFDITDRVEKVLQAIIEVTPTFQAFYAPPPRKRRDSSESVGLPKDFVSAVTAVRSLMSKNQMQFLPAAGIKFRNASNSKGSITVHRKGQGWVCRNSSGVGGAFYKRLRSPKNSLLIFSDPVAFLGSGKLLKKIIRNEIPADVYVPLRPLDRFLKENSKWIAPYKKIVFVTPNERLLWGRDEKMKEFSEEQIRQSAGALPIAFNSIDELLRELILGRNK